MLGRFKTLAASIRSKQDIIFTSKTRWAIDNYAGMRIRIRYFFQRIRILPVTMDLQNYFYLEKNINQNQQIQA